MVRASMCSYLFRCGSSLHRIHSTVHRDNFFFFSTHVLSKDTTNPDARLVIDDLPFNAGKDIDFNRWKFVYGKTNPIYDVELGERGNPYRDLREDVVGGRASNALIFLVDYNRHIRGFFPAISNPAIMEAERLATLLCIEKRKSEKQN